MTWLAADVADIASDAAVVVVVVVKAAATTAAAGSTPQTASTSHRFCDSYSTYPSVAASE